MKKILVIDDSHLVSQLLQNALTDAGYEVSVAFDANEGYQTAIAIQPDLILLDVHLPDVLGFELLNVIRNHHALEDVPVIMVTGSHHQVEHKVRGFQTGANDYILKPFEIPELLERVKVHLKQSPPKSKAADSVTPAADSVVRLASESPISPPSAPSPALTPAPTPVLPPKLTPWFPPEFVDDTPRNSEGVARPESESTLPPEPKSPELALSLREAIGALFLRPNSITAERGLPAIAWPYLMALITLVLSGVALAPGETLKPAVVGLGLLGGWTVLATALVVACSVAGVSCVWREANRVLALAGLPILLKAFCALLASAWTTLSPFYFSAGLSMLWPQGPFWAARVDLFELWSFYLLWILLRGRKAGNPQRASIIVGVVWLVYVALSLGLAHLGTPS